MKQFYDLTQFHLLKNVYDTVKHLLKIQYYMKRLEDVYSINLIYGHHSCLIYEAIRRYVYVHKSNIWAPFLFNI